LLGHPIGKVLLGAELGQFQPSRDCDIETTKQIIEVASDPSKAAVAYGMKTGNCSCCAKPLTNKVSVELGIGPICREKYGWG
jgi:hypothetical protein